MAGFDNYARMSQFGGLWRAFTCGQLATLLNDEYATRNLPQMIRQPAGPGCKRVVSSNTTASSAWRIGRRCRSWRRGFSTIRPPATRRRLPRCTCSFPSRGWCGRRSAAAAAARPRRRIGGVPGDFQTLPANPSPAPAGGGGAGRRVDGRPRALADGMGPVRSALDVPVGAGHATGLGDDLADAAEISPAGSHGAELHAAELGGWANKTWNRSTSIRAEHDSSVAFRRTPRRTSRLRVSPKSGVSPPPRPCPVGNGPVAADPIVRHGLDRQLRHGRLLEGPRVEHRPRRTVANSRPRTGQTDPQPSYWPAAAPAGNAAGH